MPKKAPVTPLRNLMSLALERLEPTTRGRVVGAITKAAKNRVAKQICPLCSTRLKHGYCYTCRKPATEVRNEYTEKVKALALAGGRLLASGEARNLDALCSKLGISDKLGTDVVATLKNAKLVKVRGLARKLMGKAIMAGIGSGISAVLWITVGGFAVLSPSVLIVILVLSLVIPITLVKVLQVRARRALK